jgi:preprotein translocase subunit SecG
MQTLITLLYILFVLSAIVLVVVVLLQEGKGGGFGDALGTAGQQTFGVKASGIHKFTGAVAVFFLASALLIHYLNRTVDEGPILEPSLLDTPAE